MKKTETKRTSFLREYGMSMREIAEKYNFNPSYIWILHQRGDLHTFIEEQKREKAEAPRK